MLFSTKFTFILYADDTTMISSMYTFTSVMIKGTPRIADNINEELSKIVPTSLLLTSYLSKFIQFHHRQKKLEWEWLFKIKN